MNLKYFLFIFIVSMMLFNTSIVSAAFPTTGSIAYWNFDTDSALFTSMVGSHTLINNGSTNITGKLGSARHFLQSSSQFISRGNTSDLNFGTGNWSVNLWVYQAGRAATADYQTRWCKGGNDVSQGFEHIGSVGWSNTTNYFESNTIDGNDGNIQQGLPGPVVNDAWHMVTYTYNVAGTGTLSFYFDGVLNVSDTTVGTWSTTSYDFLIGKSYQTANARTYMNGSIDEFGIWNTTLTQTDINNLYNGGTGITYPASPANLSCAFGTGIGNIQYKGNSAGSFPMLINATNQTSTVPLLNCTNNGGTTGVLTMTRNDTYTNVSDICDSDNTPIINLTTTSQNLSINSLGAGASTGIWCMRNYTTLPPVGSRKSISYSILLT